MWLEGANKNQICLWRTCKWPQVLTFNWTLSTRQRIFSGRSYAGTCCSTTWFVDASTYAYIHNTYIYIRIKRNALQLQIENRRWAKEIAQNPKRFVKYLLDVTLRKVENEVPLARHRDQRSRTCIPQLLVQRILLRIYTIHHHKKHWFNALALQT